MDECHVAVLIGRWFFGVTGFLGIGLLFVAPMLFDAAGSGSNPATVTLFWSIVTYPVVCLLSIVIGWLFYKFGNPFVGCVVAFVPAINLVAAVVAVICLQIFYGGKFDG
jgi:hypothetical protein